MLNLLNFLFGVLEPEGGSSSVPDILTLGLSFPDNNPVISSNNSESLAPPKFGPKGCKNILTFKY